MVYYRSIKKSYSPKTGSVTWSVHDTLLQAYRECIPKDETKTCRRVFLSVMECMESKEILCVTHTKLEDGEIPDGLTATYWIQRIHDPADPMPLDPPMPLGTCCLG